MSITTELTVQKLTPPGYFDLSEVASAKHKDFITWFQQQLDLRTNLATLLKQLVLTPWLVDFNDYPRAPYLDYLLRQYGFGYFSSTNNQAAALYKLVSSGWSTSTFENMKTVLDAFCLPPFSWFDATFLPRIFSGLFVPSKMDTGFLIYSTASSPSTPSNTAYTARAWTTPAGWTRAASSAVKYCRGYLSGANIVWSTPRAVSDFLNTPYFSASIPLSVASVGTICIVNDDGTGDKRAIYYSDGTAWRKNSMPNADLGIVIPNAARPSPEAITVWAPNPASVSYSIASSIPPPSSGPTQGYGTFAGWAGTNISANQVILRLHQLSGGVSAIAIVLAMLRRIKPVSLQIKINIDGTDYIVSDARTAS
jgi:hypothetical protein